MAERIGYTFSESGHYNPEYITVVLEADKEIAKGDLIYIDHPKNGFPVVYQVTRVYSHKKTRTYEEALLRSGSVISDDEMMSVRAKAYQWGWMDDGYLRGLRHHLQPHSSVYRASKSIIANFTKPAGSWKIHLGVDPSSQLEVELDTNGLVRQNCLICGAVGTGKTTTALSMVVKASRLRPSVRFFIVDKDGEYKGLLDQFGPDEVVNVPWISLYQSDDVTLEDFLAEFGWQRSWWTAKILDCSLKLLKTAGKRLSKDHLEKAIAIVTKDVLGFMRDDSELRDYKMQVINAIRSSGLIPQKQTVAQNPVQLLKRYKIVIMDLSKGRNGWADKHIVIAHALRRIFNEALENRRFGCVILLEEAMYYAPQRGYFEVGTRDSRDKLLSIIREIATNGGRNGAALWVVTQRLATVSKTVITQCATNTISHALEDVDKQRLGEIVGQEFIDLLGGLSQGEAIVRGSALRCRFPVWVKVIPVMFPTSADSTPRKRFLAMESEKLSLQDGRKDHTDGIPLEM